MLTEEQVDVIKQRLIAQIDATFPEDRKQFAKEQVEEMDAEQLEQFLIKNNLLRSEGQDNKESCVFCAIVSGGIRSYKIAENKKALAVLEINPLSKGHVIIIPKEHVSSKEDVPKETENLTKKISFILKSKLKPRTIKIESSNLFGHEIINVIPVYGDEEPKESKQPTPEALSELQDVLLKKPAPKIPKERKEKKPILKRIIKEIEEKLWLPKRIP